MTKDTQIACSLGAGELERRLGAMAAIGAESLLSRSVEGERHLLSFRASGTVLRQLEAIVAGEEECCAFLDLSLREEEGELVLSVSAPEGGRAAEEFAQAFSGVAK